MSDCPFCNMRDADLQHAAETLVSWQSRALIAEARVKVLERVLESQVERALESQSTVKEDES